MMTDRSPDAEAPVQESDESLIRKLREGKSQAGEELVKRHATALMRYLQRLVNNDLLAEELHQQTWMSVLENLGRFDPASSGGGFKAWLYRIATNKANDHWRLRGREKVAKEGLRLVTDELGPDAAHRMEISEDRRRLLAAIQKLPENQKQVLLLRYYGEMKFVDIAKMIGCPLNTALGRMHKAMLRLKQMLSEP
jgi:RNA polymerase sigma factor (sigma-70 family)